MSISLPAEKMRKLTQDAEEVVGQVNGECDGDVGKTTAAKKAIRVAPLFHRHLQALINSVIPHLSTEEICKGYNQTVELSHGARKELTWWSQEAVRWNSAPINFPYCRPWSSRWMHP